METIQDQYLEAIADAVPECKEVLEWIDGGGVSDLIDRLIAILKEKLDEEG